MNYLIIEDEFRAARRLDELVQKIQPGAECLDVIDSVEDAVSWFGEHDQPDLAFFDIQLADGLSFSIFEQVRIDTPVIFTTAFDEYAIRAFKENSVDYLLKPIDEQELERALDKFERTFSKADANFDSDLLEKLRKSLSSRDKVRRFLIKQGSGLSYVPVEEIAYFFSENGMTFLVTHSRKKHLIDYTLEQVGEMVDEADFNRVNRGLIVNIGSIAGVEDYFNSRLVLKLKPDYSGKAIVSRDRVRNFKNWFGA